MLSEEIRSRLAQLDRALPGRAGNRRHIGASGAVGGTGDGRWQAQQPPPVCLHGRELRRALGTHWVVQQSLDQIWSQGSEWIQRCRAEWECNEDQVEYHAEVQAFRDRFPDQTVFLDLETCGFAGSMVFLAGILHRSENGLVLSQLLARNYAEEGPMLESLWQWVADCRVLVTFNGKSFDWPQVIDRSTLHRLGPFSPSSGPGGPRATPCDAAVWEAAPVHFDLLHHARRHWRHRLPNCKLQTLERQICGRNRTADIPGHEIPAAYHQFVRTGDAPAMRTILHHNALDLITLLQLSLRIAAATHPQTDATSGLGGRARKTKKAASLRPTDADGSQD